MADLRPSTDLGTRIRAAREKAGLTLRALARGMGVSAPFLSEVEHGRMPLSDRRIRDCAAVLSIKPDALLAAAPITRDSARLLSRDVALLRAVRRAMADKLIRRAVLKAAASSDEERE